MDIDNVKQEIIRLHNFFVDWMTGILPQTDENFALFADSISKDFYIVNSSGQLRDRETLVAKVYSTYNQRPKLRIWIENMQIHHTLGDVIVATYEEWQEDKSDNKTTSLISTVVFILDESKHNGLVWQCVHETSLQAE